MTDAREAQRREQSFISNLSGAQDDYEWIVENQAWAALGWDTFAEWWQARVTPIMRALSMRPTREIAAAVIEQVRQEEAELPPAQRRTQRELAEMVGVGEATVGRIAGTRSTGASPDARTDLGTPHPSDQPASGPLTDAERDQAAVATETIRAGLDRIDTAIMQALSNGIDPVLIVGWLTSAQHGLARLNSSAEFLDPLRQVVFEPRIQFLLTDGRAVAAELAGPDTCRKPLTEPEVAALAAVISGGTQ